METNPNIIRLLEMLDHPDAYTQQEIRDIISADDETRSAYRLAVAAKQGYTHRNNRQPADAEAAWQRFEAEHLSTQPISEPQKTGTAIYKIAASFVGLLLVSGIAFATIHIVRQSQQTEAVLPVDTTAIANTSRTTQQPSLPVDSSAVQPIVYDNKPLELMLQQIAGHYGVGVAFHTDELRQLRFHFVWNPQQDLLRVVSDLNQFERLHVELKDNVLMVE